ncbi:unnamed protein product [Mytilus edulis]|uniref:G-protein coupled receptors family 1 profile domain-containing protein n=1 Tax=Mytilus edulis TaxID=6550 RepID=A0A8S3S130_MYTED|nr:unnamed protein product [Mytilus edulis]
MEDDDNTIQLSLNYSNSYDITTIHFNLSTNSDDVSHTDVQTIKEAAKWLWIIVSPILLVFGLIGNIGILLVLWRIKVCKNLTYIFLFILATVNTVVLIVGLTRYWILATFDLDIRDISTPGCVSQLFLIYFSMHMSSWTLVCITTIRFLQIKFSLRCRAKSFSRTLAALYIVTLVICVALDLHFFFTNGLILEDNEYVCSNTSDQYYEFEEKVYVLIDLAMLSVIPFLIMFIMNLFIGKRVLKSIAFRRISISNKQSRRRVNRQSKRITQTLFFSSLYFIITTLPVSVLFVVDSYLPANKSVQMQANLELVKAVLYLFQFSFYAIGFYIYIEIRASIRGILPCCNDKHRSNSQTSISRRTTSFSTTSQYFCNDESTDVRINSSESRNSMSRGVSSFSTASRYLSSDESRIDMNSVANDGTETDINSNSNIVVPNYQFSELSVNGGTETDINSNSNTFVPTYQFSELSATCQSLPNIQNRQLSLSATCQSITESPNGSSLEPQNSIHSINHSDIENTRSGDKTRTNRISFDFSSTSICHTIRELEPLDETWL